MNKFNNNFYVSLKNQNEITGADIIENSTSHRCIGLKDPFKILGSRDDILPPSQWVSSLGEIIKYTSHELSGAELLTNYIDLTNYITDVMINTSANIQFNKMLYPSASNNYFLMDTGIFTQIDFYMLAGYLDNNQIINDTITGTKIISLPIEKLWNINTNILNYNPTTFLNGKGNFIFLNTGTNINYTVSTIPLNTIIFPNYDNTEFLNDQGTFIKVSFTGLSGSISLTQIPNNLITFNKMVYPGTSNNYFLMDNWWFTQVNFNMLSGSIALTQIPNNLITYVKLNLSANDIPYNIINIPTSTINFNKMIYPGTSNNYFLMDNWWFTQVNFNMLSGSIALTQIPNNTITYIKLNLSANDIPYNIINIPSSTITFNKMIYPTPTGLFLRDDGTFQSPTAGTIPNNSIDLIKLLTVVGNANNLYLYNSWGVPSAGKLTNDYINNNTISLNKIVNGSPNAVLLYSVTGILTTWLLNANYFEVTPSYANQVLNWDAAGNPQQTKLNYANNNANSSAFVVACHNASGVAQLAKINFNHLESNIIYADRTLVFNSWGVPGYFGLTMSNFSSIGSTFVACLFNGSGSPITGKIDNNYFNDNTISGTRISNLSLTYGKMWWPWSTTNTNFNNGIINIQYAEIPFTNTSTGFQIALMIATGCRYTAPHYFFGASSTNAYYWWGFGGSNGESYGHYGNGDSNLIISACDSITGQYGATTLWWPSLIFQDEDAIGGVATNAWLFYLNISGTVVTSWNKKLKHWIREYNKDMLWKFKELKLFTYVYKHDEFNFNKCFENNEFNEKKARRLYRKSKTLQFGV